MSFKPVRVLLVGGSATRSPFLQHRLEQRGCKCDVATSSSEAARLSAGYVFDLVLCTEPVEGIDALIALLVGSPATAFRCYPVEDGCWWLPAVRHGVDCRGVSALRPREFASALEEVLQEIHSGRHLRAQTADRDDKRLQGHSDPAVQPRLCDAEIHNQPNPIRRNRP
jgi:hypothetical protein